MDGKSKKIRLIYGVAFSILTVLIGMFFIFGSFRIFAVGGYAQGSYSREAVGKVLLILSFPFVIWVAAIIAAYVIDIKFPAEISKTTHKNDKPALKRLLQLVPKEADDSLKSELKTVYKEEWARLIVNAICALVYIVCIILGAVYVFNKENFPAEDLNVEMFGVLFNTLPWLLVSLAATVGGIIYKNYSIKRELAAVKKLVASNKNKAETKNPLLINPVFGAIENVKTFFKKVKGAMSTKAAKWSVRGCVFAVAVTFVVLGIFNNGMQEMMTKAINICTECIGLG